MGITDHLVSTRSQGFLYDALNRLTQAQSSAYGTITYNYDEIGNMTYNSQVGSYTYWKDYYGTKPHAVYQAGANTYGYDANGNMTSSPGKTITYNYDNMPVSINGTTFVYDFSGQRVKKNSTIYIGKLYECTGGTCTKYIFAGSNRIAYKTGSAVYYYHTDHLGSSSIITNESGTKVNELYYYPYGKTRYALDSSLTHKFTGQEEDEETGLYYFGARYYDPAIGRFVSADSIVPDFTDPQTLNRYSYCRNNPLLYVDPSGHFFLIDDIIVAAVTYIAANAAVIAEGAAIGAVIGGATAAVTGGNIGTGMLTGAISGAIFGGVGSIPGMGSGEGAFSSITQAGIHAGAGAVSGGINAAITGGDIGMGMLTGGIAGGIANYAGGFLPDDFGYQFAGRTLIGGVTGGITAEIYGGDFGQGFIMGAKTGAIGFMANHWLHNVKGWFGKYIKQIFSGAYGDVNAMAGIVGGGYLVNSQGEIYPYYCGGLGYGLTITGGGSGFTPGEWFVALQVSSGPVTTQYGYAFQSGPFSEAGVAAGSALSGTVCYIRKSPINP